jgi:hypothetical protein
VKARGPPTRMFLELAGPKTILRNISSTIGLPALLASSYRGLHPLLLNCLASSKPSIDDLLSGQYIGGRRLGFPGPVGLPSQPLPDLGQDGALGIAQPRSRWQLCLKITFSAARYSFCRSNSWFIEPVTYASGRTHLLFRIARGILSESNGRAPSANLQEAHERPGSRPNTVTANYCNCSEFCGAHLTQVSPATARPDRRPTANSSAN